MPFVRRLLLALRRRRLSRLLPLLQLLLLLCMTLFHLLRLLLVTLLCLLRSGVIGSLLIDPLMVSFLLLH